MGNQENQWQTCETISASKEQKSCGTNAQCIRQTRHGATRKTSSAQMRKKNNASTWHITMRADHTSKLTSQTQSDIIVVDNTLIMVILNAQNELEQCDDEEPRRTTRSTGGPRAAWTPSGRQHRAAWKSAAAPRTPLGSVDTIGQRGHHRAARTPSGSVDIIQGLPERPRSPRATEEPRRTTRSHARAAYRGRVLSALVAAA